MEFLEDLNIPVDVIDEINANHTRVELYELSTHCTNATKIINYFREIGISDDSIYNMLIYCMHIFMIKFAIVKESLEENKEEVVAAVNDDFSAIEQFI